MIADEELRDIFQMESEERLTNLEQGLLHLEQHPEDKESLENVFREAHSLKGSSRMLGIVGVEKIAHRFEDLLGEARRGELVLTSHQVDRLCNQLDAIRALVKEAVTGEEADVDLAQILAQIDGADVKDAPEQMPAVEDVLEPGPEQASVDVSEQMPAVEDVLEPAPEQIRAHEGTSEEPVASVLENSAQTPLEREGFRIETIRVDPKKLDALIRQAGELAVTRQRMTGRLQSLEDLIVFWDAWRQDLKQEKSDVDSTAHLEQFGLDLNALRSDISEDHDHLESIATQLEEDIRSIRLLPLSTVFNLFSRTVRDLAREQKKEVRFVIEGGDITADKLILEEIKDPLMHMVRNAVDHGIELPSDRLAAGKPAQATVTLSAIRVGSRIVIEIVDDGRGLDPERIRETALTRKLYTSEELAKMTKMQIQQLIFVAGFSTKTMITDVSGRGVGLDVVRENVEHLKGSMEIESETGKGCCIRLSLPITVATSQVLLVASAGQTYALPVEYVQTICALSPDALFTLEGRMATKLNDQPVSLARLSDLLQVHTLNENVDTHSGSELPCVIIRFGMLQLGLLVDALIDEQEVVVRPAGAFLDRVRHVSGTTILGTGEICIVLNPSDLVAFAQRQVSPVLETTEEEDDDDSPLVILLAEDSLTTRTQERRILERAGYEVVTAVDGLDAFNKLRSQRFDGVVSDVEMPNMDGLTLTEKIRQDDQYAEIPVVLVTSLAKETDRQKGLEAGANAYITKPSFNQKVLLDTLERLL